jgi:hypothetical protein
MGGAMFEVGVEMFNMSLLLVGFFETTFLGPFGFFKSGIGHLVDGGMALPKSMFLMLLVFPKTIGVM